MIAQTNPPSAASDAAAAAAAPAAVPLVSVGEILNSFEAFIAEHGNQQRALYDQMMCTIREMYAVANPADDKGTSAGSLRKTKKKLTANRVSLASLNNLALYLTAHQRLVSSLIGDIADGKIGKTSRKVAISKRKIVAKKRKVESDGGGGGGEAPGEIVEEGIAKSQKMIDKAEKLLRRLEGK